jgi:hypothetical protein
MTRIFIEGYELDLTQGLSNQITYSIDDLQNLDSKTTNFTKTIILPGTANNNKLLGNIFEFNNANFDNPLDANVLANFNAARNAVARIEVNGLQIMKGVLRLLEIVQTDGAIEYECAIFGELGGFINALGNSRIEDLNFSSYNHTYSYANIVASWDTSGSTGYCYPLIDYGNVSTGTYGVAKKDFQYTTFKPALFLREYITKIIANSGYTYECDFFDTAKFRNLVVPNNSKQLTKETSEVLRLTTEVGQFLNESTTIDFVSYENKTGSLFTAASGNTAFIYNGAAPLTTTLTIEILGSYSLARGAFSISVRKNGVLVPGSSQIYDNEDSLFYSRTLPISFVTNDVLQIRSSGTLEEGDFIDVTTSFVNVINNVATITNVELGDSMVVNDTIPKGIFQKDFFISVLKMFNLLVTEDKNRTNHLIIKPYINFWSGTILDWSDKMDRSKTIKIKPMSEINARYYNLKYKQDNDFYNEDYRKKFNEGYGDRIYDNGLEFTKDTESVEVIFASSPLFGTNTTDKVFPAIYKKSNENTKEDPIDHIVRLMQIKKVTSVASWNILNLATNLGSNTSYLYAGHLNNPTTPSDDINFGAPQQLYFNLTSGDLSNNLFNTYYSSYLAEVTDKDSRLLTAYFNLTDLDIFNLDFSKFIFIDGGLYRINKIIDYAPENNELTKVDLLRVVNKEYFDAPPLPTTTSTTTSTTTAGPTTTTTTTAAPTTTTTSTTTTTTTYSPDPCVCVMVNLTSAGGEVATFNCFGANENYVYSTSGIKYLCAAVIGGLLQAEIVSGTGTIEQVGNCKTGTCPPPTTTTTTAAPTTTTTTTAAPTTTTTTTAAPTTTTTTTAAPTTTTTTTAAPTTTTTSTTTTTTTLPGITLSANPGCSGGEGTGTITANGFSGGSESFEYIAISSTSNSDALSRLDNSATRTFLGGATEFTYTMLANATYYVAIMDDLGNKGVSSGAVVNCVTTTTTTTSTTTTTTTAAPTTTTTSTTTTTTTLGYALVDIANDTAGTDITNITINGVQVDGAVFPIVAGDGASASTTQTGSSRSIIVSYTNISGDSVEVIDTASNVTCISATSTSRAFNAQVVADGGTLTIAMFDGTCP